MARSVALFCCAVDALFISVRDATQTAVAVIGLSGDLCRSARKQVAKRGCSFNMSSRTHYID
ncbi:hypothetical protein EHS86_04860 [Erwinia amylovora]|nr:hypothetical protein AD997_14320 [Erwinia amylovora]RWS40051.1 hypothetical protein EHS86_04860 [Erwinia amylovora]CCO77501.1 hypothetical protein BN432_0670 [Erwinia amylovora Ea356]